MGNRNVVRTALYHYGALDSRLGKDEMVSCLPHQYKPCKFKDLQQFAIVYGCDLRGATRHSTDCKQLG